MTIGLPVHTYSVNNRGQEFYNGLTPRRPQVELIGRVACLSTTGQLTGGELVIRSENA